MEPQTNIPQQIVEYRECFKCWYRAETAATQCPKCGKVLRNSKNIRTRGIIGIVTGLFLALFMGAIAVGVAFMLAAAMKNPESARKINAESGTLLAIYGLFAMVIVFGLHSIIIGIYHVVTGRRNRILIWMMWALLFALLFAGGALQAFL